jgi:hypothetical protein
MRWRRSAALQRRKEDDAVGENDRCGAAKFRFGATPIIKEREWWGSGWWPCGGEDGGGSVGCGGAGSRAGEAGEEREGRKQGRLVSGA